MDARKYFPFFRKAILAITSFWGYFLVRVFVEGFIKSLYYNDDTQFVGVHNSFYIVSAIAALLAIIPYAYDTFVCDTVECLDYLEKLNGDEERFSFKRELKKSFNNKIFCVGLIAFSLFSLLMFDYFEAVFCIAVYIFADCFAKKRWFSGRNHKELVKKPKKPYFFSLIGHIFLWVFIYFGAIWCVVALKASISSIANLLYRAFIVVAIAVAILMVFLFFYRRIRAIRIQRRLIKKLLLVCKENRIKFKPPKNLYASLLLQRVSYFQLVHKSVTFNCVLIPTILRKTPLYFLGLGLVQRVHTFYFMKIVLFKREKLIEYKLQKPTDNTKNIILLSPIPRAFFIGPQGNPQEGDNSSEIDNALIYSGTAFCNYIERAIPTEIIYEKEKKEIKH